MLSSKRDFADVIKLRLLRWRDYLEGPDVITVLIKGKQISESEMGDVITERLD